MDFKADCFLNCSPNLSHIITGNWWNAFKTFFETDLEAVLHFHPPLLSPPPPRFDRAVPERLRNDWRISSYFRIGVSCYTEPFSERFHDSCAQVNYSCAWRWLFQSSSIAIQVYGNQILIIFRAFFYTSLSLSLFFKGKFGQLISGGNFRTLLEHFKGSFRVFFSLCLSVYFSLLFYVIHQSSQRPAKRTRNPIYKRVCVYQRKKENGQLLQAKRLIGMSFAIEINWMEVFNLFLFCFVLFDFNGHEEIHVSLRK